MLSPLTLPSGPAVAAAFSQPPGSESPGSGANLLLGLFAAVLATIGVAGAWVGAHQALLRRIGQRIAAWGWSVRLRRFYTGQIERLVGRFRPAWAYVVPIGAGLSVLVLGAGAFATVAGDVLAHEEIALVDLPVSRFVAERRLGWLTAAIQVVNLAGSLLLITSLVVAVGIALRLVVGRWRPLALLAATAAGAAVLDAVAATVIGRAGPPTVLALPGYAVGAGVATQAAVYGGLGFLLAMLQRTWRARVTVWVGVFTVAAMTGAARVYLAASWLTDVLAGWALAAAWLAVVFTVTATVSRLRPSAAVLPAGTAAPGRESTAPAGRVPAPAPAGAPVRDATGPAGLSAAQVAQRVAAGQVNRLRQRASRSLVQILVANIFTRFNALLGTLAVVILWVGSPRDALFGLVIIANSGIGVVQELRAKRTLDRLVLVAAPRARVIRDATEQEVAIDRVVLDDLVDLRPGDIIPVDAMVLSSDGLEVDESLLTGEAEPVSRLPGQQVLAGSLVVAGGSRIQAVRVGPDTFAARLAAQARQFQLTRSELRAGVNLILRYVSWVLAPIAVLLFVSQLTRAGSGWTDAVHGSVAGVVGMVPEGLVLLTSVAMAAAVIRLGRRDVLIQELAAVEALARVDVLCLDKTGTLTDGTIAVEEVIDVSPSMLGQAPARRPDPATALGALTAADPNPNATMRALAGFGLPAPSWAPTSSIRFTSARRWSSVTFGPHGTVLLGAPEALLDGLPGAGPLLDQTGRIAASGRRVLAVAHSTTVPAAEAPALPADRVPLALVVLTEHVRPDAAQTLRYFTGQGVRLKVISGDNPTTVAAVAGRAGVPGADHTADGSDLPADAERLAEIAATATVFGRIDPHQKRNLIGALRRRGHTVAMTGDGVNDVLALKDADLGIGLGSGAAASRAIAQVVLLRGQFAALPSIVAEGRRVIANIERTANLFVTKTVYVVLLALAVGVVGVSFPFLPRHLTLIGTLTIGVPGFFLALAPNARRARPGFVRRVLAFAAPAGAIAAAVTLGAYGLTRQLAAAEPAQASTAATLALAGAGLSVLSTLVGPAAGWQRVLAPALAGCLAAVLCTPPVRDFFALTLPGGPVWILLGVTAALGHVLIRLTGRMAERVQYAPVRARPERRGRTGPGAGITLTGGAQAVDSEAVDTGTVDTGTVDSGAVDMGAVDAGRMHADPGQPRPAATSLTPKPRSSVRAARRSRS